MKNLNHEIEITEKKLNELQEKLRGSSEFFNNQEVEKQLYFKIGYLQALNKVKRELWRITQFVGEGSEVTHLLRCESIYCKYCIDNKLKPKPDKILGKDLRV